MLDDVFVTNNGDWFLGGGGGEETTLECMKWRGRAEWRNFWSVESVVKGFRGETVELFSVSLKAGLH